MIDTATPERISLTREARKWLNSRASAEELSLISSKSLDGALDFIRARVDKPSYREFEQLQFSHEELFARRKAAFEKRDAERTASHTIYTDGRRPPLTGAQIVTSVMTGKPLWRTLEQAINDER